MTAQDHFGPDDSAHFFKMGLHLHSVTGQPCPFYLFQYKIVVYSVQKMIQIFLFITLSLGSITQDRVIRNHVMGWSQFSVFMSKCYKQIIGKGFH